MVNCKFSADLQLWHGLFARTALGFEPPHASHVVVHTIAGVELGDAEHATAYAYLVGPIQKAARQGTQWGVNHQVRYAIGFKGVNTHVGVLIIR